MKLEEFKKLFLKMTFLKECETFFKAIEKRLSSLEMRIAALEDEGKSRH